MTHYFLQIGLSNACFSLALAIVAMVAGAKAKRPHLAHALWLLVFVKLVTPPIVSIPIVTIPQQHEATAAIADNSPTAPIVAGNRQFDIDGQSNASLSARIGSLAIRHGKEWLPPIWLLGSVVVFAWSMVRVSRFSRLLAAESEVAPQQLQTAAAKIARRLGLNKTPTIYTTSTRLSPLVWWAGGKVRIVIPTVVLEKMEPQQSQWILAHELAHVRRRDYLVRWIEWLACVCFWWNPVVWWAQRNLRATEEICCDALVLSSMHPKPKSYANSILKAVESIACPTLRPPTVASEINSGGFLERRFKMIVSNNPKRSNSRWLQTCVLLCAMVVLPLGIASAHDYEAVEKRLRAAIEAGELTPEQARAMMGTLKKAGTAKKDTDYDAIGKKSRAAVKAGKMTKEAKAKLAGTKKGAHTKKKKKADTDYRTIAEKIEAAVKAGKITEEEAKAKLARIKKGADAKKKKKAVTDYRAIAEKIEAAVKAGKMTEEEAKAKLAGIKKGADAKKKKKADTDHRTIGEKIEAAVKAGKMTEEEAKAKWAGIKKGADAKKKKKADTDYRAIGEKIEAAVKAGKMTKEEAKAKWAEIKKKAAAKDKDDD